MKKLTKNDVEQFFGMQFCDAMCGLSDKAPFAGFGPVCLRYEPESDGVFKQIKWGVYLFKTSDLLSGGSGCPIGKYEPIFEVHFDYMPLPQEIWYKYGDQIFAEFENWYSAFASRRK